MKRGCLTALVVLAAIIGGIVLWYRFSFPTYIYRYRMTVSVDTPEGVRSGSSVIEGKLVRMLGFPNPPGWGAAAYGEAVFVDLGDGKNAIALLASGPNGSYVDYPQTIISSLTKLDGGDRDAPKYPHLEGRWQVPEEKLPTLVTFADLNDPLTARVVAPSEFPAVFGEGFALRDVTIEMTKDPVTRGIEGKLPWLNHLEKYNKVPSNPFSNIVPFGRPHLSRS